MAKGDIKRKLAFVYDHEYPHLWKDGLDQALIELGQDFDITYFNLREQKMMSFNGFDFILGWGGFNSPVDNLLKHVNHVPKGLCIGGNAFPPESADAYDVLFYETDWYYPQIAHHRNARKAFGVNTTIYYPTFSEDLADKKLFDVITVGAFSNWKRQHFIMNYQGQRLLAVGQIQRENLPESLSIIKHLLLNGVTVSDMVEPERLAELYNASSLCYIPAEINGGGERAILEARACGLIVECEDDNPKLKELCTGPIPTEHDYYLALKEGIESCL